MDFDGRMEQIVLASAIPYRTVVDSSAFGLDSRVGSMCRGSALADSSKFYKWLSGNMPENFIFSDELREEFEYFSVAVRRRIGHRKKEFGNEARSRESRGMRISSISRNLELLHEKKRDFSNWMVVRKELSREHFTKKRVEDCLPEGFDCPIEEWPVYQVVLRTQEMTGAMKTYESGEEPKFDGNDLKIFAKSIAMSYERPVAIVTRDNDFVRLRNDYYDNIEFLSETFGFGRADNPVYIVSLFDEGSIVHLPGGTIIPLRYVNWKPNLGVGADVCASDR